MPAYISPLDERFITLGRAATLIAVERPGLAASDIMDLFKRAIFTGELEGPGIEDPNRDDDRKWLHIEIVLPRPNMTPLQGELPTLPKQLYGVGADSIASVLLTTDALPGGRAAWKPLFDFGNPAHVDGEALDALANIPFREFPASGRRQLRRIISPKAKLAAWLARDGHPVPQCLSQAESMGAATQPLTSTPPRLNGARPEARRLGRPPKSAWPRIIALLHELHAAHPDWSRKQLAFAVWEGGRQEFQEDALPSLTTLLRAVGAILDEAD